MMLDGPGSILEQEIILDQTYKQRYWDVVTGILEGIFKVENAAKDVDDYRKEIVFGERAHPTLIYHNDPLAIAETIARQPIGDVAKARAENIGTQTNLEELTKTILEELFNEYDNVVRQNGFVQDD